MARTRERNAVIRAPAQSPPVLPDFVKAEKNLLSLGLFTPMSKELRKAKSKTIAFRRVDGDRVVEAEVTIAASAVYGLPDTADQDKYLALQKLITERRRTEGKIANPLAFTTYELLKILGRSKGGKRYDDVNTFLQRLTLTGIQSKRAIYLADRKNWVSETFHVFEKVVSVGESLPDGTVAQKNYIWWSDWQLNNINSNFTLPIDMEAYRHLRNHIAKALVPHLQIWLYTSRSEGCFTKRYDQLCQLLGLQKQKHPSRIKQQLGPSLDELREHDYIGSWAILETRDGRGYKVELYHGAKFHRDLRLRQGEKLEDEPLTLPADVDEDGEVEAPRDVLAELTRRGISTKVAQQLLERARDTAALLDQLEWADYLISENRDRFYNPAGFYVTVIRDNVPVPPDFETSRKRALRASAQAERSHEEEQERALQVAYEEYCATEIDRHIESEYPGDKFAEIIEVEKDSLLQNKKHDFGTWPSEKLTQYAAAVVRRRVTRNVDLPTFQDYVHATNGGALS